jgi:hypothetical protein
MDLTDPYLKTSRAKEHLDSLRIELGMFYGTEPCKFAKKIDVKNRVCQLRIQVKDPPPRLSIIAGDIFGCLRASLDHLIWLLVTNSTGS